MDTGMSLAAWIVSDPPALRTCPEDGRPVQGGVRFGDRLYVAEEEPQEIDGRLWRLLLRNVGDADGDKFAPVGWAGEEELLQETSPLTDPDTSISYKALVTNKGEAGGEMVIPVYFNPGLKGERPAHKLAVRSIFYIYQGHPREMEEAISDGIPEGMQSLLIGFLPVLDTVDDSAGLGLLGWIDRRYVTLWNTREALTLHGRIPIYKGKQSAANHNHKDIVAGSSGREIRHDTVRSPVLNAEEGLYKIGFFGEIDPKSLSFQGGFGGTRIQLQVHYVLDATRSMGRWLQVTKSTVERSQQEISGMAKRLGLPAPTYGVTFYRDRAVRSGRPNNPECAEETSTHPQTPKVGEFLNTLEEEPACDWGDKDRPESVYSGLLSAINRARFDRFGYRLIIHLGDAGDHGRGASFRQVLEGMTRNRINYFALDVSPRGTALSASVRELVEKRRAGHADADLYIGTEGAEERVLELLQNATRTVARQTEVLEALKKGFGGEGGTAEAIFSDKVYRQVLEMLDTEGITLIENRNLQLYEEGWVNSVDGKGQPAKLSPTLLVSRDDLMKLIVLLTDLTEADPSPRRIRRVWSKTIEEFTGDVCNVDEKLRECFEQAGAVMLKSPVLRHSLDELAKMAATNIAQFREFRCGLKMARAKLSGILEEKKYRYTRTKGGECKIEAKHLGDRKYWYTPLTDMQLAWVPVDDMP